VESCRCIPRERSRIKGPTPPRGNSVYERTDRIGRELAERVLKSAIDSPPVRISTVGGVDIALPLPPPQIKLSPNHRLPIWVGRALLDDTTSIQILRLGPVLLLGVPCDLGAEIGLDLKQYARSKGYEAIVVGFANDYIGYVIPDKYYSWPTYEAFMSFNGPYMADYISLVLEQMIDRTNPEQETSAR